MFIAIASLTIGLIAWIAMRDWVRHPRYCTKAIQKMAKNVSQAVLLQDWEKAQKELDHLKQSGKGGKEAALLEIQILRGTGRVYEALQRTIRCSHLYPEELLFRLEEGRLLLQLERPIESLEAFQVCSPIIRSESETFDVALAQFKAGKIADSFETLTPLLKNTQSGQTLALAADIYFEQKVFPKAIDAYLIAIEMGYQSHHVLIQLGHAYRRLGNLAESEKLFRNLLESNPADHAARLGLGSCLQERGHYHKAFFLYQTGLGWIRDISLVHRAALMALKIRKYSVAERYFLEIMQNQGPDPQTLSYYAFCLECQKKWQEAEQTYLKHTQLFPVSHQGYRALAWMFGVGLSQTLSQEQGLNFAHLAVKLKNDALSWEILSACIARMGQFDRAYQIQLSLSQHDQDASSRARRQQCLRRLRKKIPLDDLQVVRSQVA